VFCHCSLSDKKEILIWKLSTLEFILLFDVLGQSLTIVLCKLKPALFHWVYYKASVSHGNWGGKNSEIEMYVYFNWT